MRIFFLVLLALLTISACQNHKEDSRNLKLLLSDTNYLDEGPTGSKIVIYQMMTRLFGNTQNVNIPYGTLAQNGVGKFQDITPAALASLKELGITHVWYTGVLEHATLTDYRSYGISLDDADVVKGRAGSPYAIKDYYDVNPDLAVDVPRRMEEFEALIQRTHDAGMQVLIDFVPNHVARGYESDMQPEGVEALGVGDNKKVAFSSSNNFYYLPNQSLAVPDDYDPLGPEIRAPKENGAFPENPAKVSGNDVFSAEPKVWDWFETVKLNYGIDYQNDRTPHFDPIPSTWEKMKEILVFWAEKGRRWVPL